MCNAYNTAKDPGKIQVEVPSGASIRLIRRTDQAPVILPGGDVSMMRWGFERKGLGVVNNTRTDNLESSMWRESFENRPCLVPLASYFEWTGSKGNKRTHRFRNSANQWLFAAGIWEESPTLGRCFSMLTTEANSLVAPIHHRMPALLKAEEIKAYFENKLQKFAPPADLLLVEESANPLLSRPPSHIQGDLF